MTPQKIEIPAPVRSAIERLTSAGHVCFPVGGCVRDALRGALPADWDLCTSALPAVTYACMEGYERFDIGAAHGTVGVIIDGMPIEITTFRVDGGYSDGRHPDGVRFTPDLREDLARRDFTVNAMALDGEGRVIDLFGGQADLRRGVIRCVGEPAARLREDSLRVMRALRFASVLGFRIEKETETALRDEREGLSRVARERILVEWRKLLGGEGALAVIDAFPEVIGAAFPRWSEALCEEARREAALLRMKKARTPIARWARLLSGLGLGDAVLSGEPMAREEMEILRFLLARENEAVPAPCDVRKWLRGVGERGLALGSLLWEGKAGGAEATRELERIRDEGLCFTVSGRWGLKVNGADVIACTGARGAQVGAVLERLADAVAEGEIENEREALLRELQTFTRVLPESFAERHR